ncbi:MAG: hypothetical protein KJ607_12855 [Bacteroidetes bacterium]|nr:hypothetical protein [Bacteroidota bacterium]
MKSITIISVITCLLTLVISGCNQNQTGQPDVPVPETVQPDNKIENAGCHKKCAPVATTITYDVLIKNPDEEDAWTAEHLKDVDVKKLTDIIFDAVYSGQLTPYNFLSGEPMTIEDVKEIESRENYSREIIGKVQFVEEWKIDTVNFSFHKEVKQLMMAYEKYDNNAELIGYTATFLIKLDELQELSEAR